MIEVIVSEDGMTAELFVSPEPEEELNKQIIIDTLKLEGIQAGIDEEVITNLLENKLFNRNVQVASGKAPVDGQDGYYVYFFDVNAGDGLPRIREDGSVDYSKVIANVSAGELLAEYHPETYGTFGYNVFARALAPVRGKAQRVLRCKHVRRDENLYFAEIDGHASVETNAIIVNNVLDIREDANYNVGNIKFNGDIHVHGNITGGVTITAEGSVIVDGVIEDAKVYADLDIIVSRGIHGQGTRKDGVQMEEGNTMVDAKRDLRTRFIDHAFARTDGDIYMDYAIGSVIEAEGKVTAKGRKGIIVGGSTYALLGVEANRLGNDVELFTEINAGYSKTLNAQTLSCRQKAKDLEDELVEMTEIAKIKEYRAKIQELRAQVQVLENEAWQKQISPVIVHSEICHNVKIMFGETPAPDMNGISKVEIRKINGNILCKPVGTFSKALLYREPLAMEDKPIRVKTKVLIIDDDVHFLRTMHQLLERQYQVAVAPSGKVARKYLETNEADIILLDYIMSEENGVEVLKSFRAWDKVKDVPVVFLTGLDDKKKIKECLSLRPAGYIMKPVEKEKLFAKIHAIVGEGED